MGKVELWLGPAGCGKTREALKVLRATLRDDWHGVRYLVPTVHHKRSIERLVLSDTDRPGLFGDPINIFYSFAAEVAARAGVRITPLTELQKPILLRQLISETPLDYFHRAAQYPGFTAALGDTIDELKVQMVEPDALLRQAPRAAEAGAVNLARKLHELGTLYQRYQAWMHERERYDSEGMMWVAAAMLRRHRDLYRDQLRCLILDGFARLTPIQIDFLAELAPRVERTIVLLDYEEGRSVAYRPVVGSLERLRARASRDKIDVVINEACAPSRDITALAFARRELFRDRRQSCPPDDSLRLLVGANPAHEVELIAREIRALLRRGVLDDGTPIGAADIAVIARQADAVHDRLARAFRRYGIPAHAAPPTQAHTAIGRMLLAAFRIARHRWRRDDVLAVLHSGLLPIDAPTAFHIDIIARRHYLRERRATWFEQWPDEATASTLSAALAPLAAFDDACQGQHGRLARITEAVRELLRAIDTRGTQAVPPLPDVDAPAAARYVEAEVALREIHRVLDDLDQLSDLMDGASADDPLEIVTSALQRADMPLPARYDEGVAILSVHATGGEKFRVIFLSGLLEGHFPRHQRESAFLMDHEREDTLKHLQIHLDTRKSLEDDERYWFLHALSSATHHLYLSYPEHDAAGGTLERSAFLDEICRLMPELIAARRTTFNDIAPAPEAAETVPEYLAGLAHRLRTDRDTAGKSRAVAAYSVCAPDGRARLARYFRHAREPLGRLRALDAWPAGLIASRALSASEIQSYLDCPYLWFGAYVLGVEVVIEEFGPLDRGIILHAVLEHLYQRITREQGSAAGIRAYTPDELWPDLEADLQALVEREPRFRNRKSFFQQIEWEALCRLLRRFVIEEIARVSRRATCPTYFERPFGWRASPELRLRDGTPLYGKIDRIDVAEDGCTAVVIDYKTSLASMTHRALTSGAVIQAPLYLLAAQRVFGLQPIGVEFLGLRQSDSKGLYREGIETVYPSERGLAPLDAAAWSALLDDSETRACRVADAMRHGDISLAPTTPRCPRQCDYYALCRLVPSAYDDTTASADDRANVLAGHGVESRS